MKNNLKISLFVVGLILLTYVSIEYCNRPVSSDIASWIHVNKKALEKIKKDHETEKQIYKDKIALLEFEKDSILNEKAKVIIKYRDRYIYVDSFSTGQQDQYFIDEYNGPVTDSTVKNAVIKDIVRKDELEELSKLDQLTIKNLNSTIEVQAEHIEKQDSTINQLSKLADSNMQIAESLKTDLQKANKRLGRSRTLNKVLAGAVIVMGGTLYIMTK